MDDATARRLLLVRAYDSADSPLWTADDATWASRLAAQTAAPDASPLRFLDERARHALQRLAPRDRDIARWLAPGGVRAPWVAAVALAGLALGLMGDLLGRSAIVDIIAPAVWGVIAWNLAVYLLLALSALRPGGAQPGAIRRALARVWQGVAGQGPLREASRQWLPLAAPATASRVATLLHVGAAAIAAGLAAGLYLRGLVFDFRAGWQSTFVDAETVQRTLALLLAPASALTGIGVPDIASIDAMRLTPAVPNASASAAPWIHLYAATIGLIVVAPRLVLALLSWLQGAWRARRIALSLDDPYFQRLLQQRRAGPATVVVCPHAAAPGAPALLALRTLLAREFGDDVQLTQAGVTRLGDEEHAGAAPGASLQVAWVELGATPEAETHGLFLRTLRQKAPGTPTLLVADEADFVRRFGAWPARIDERRQAWRSLAESQDVAWFAFDQTRAGDAALQEGLAQALSP
jgi:Protein of unknown function (DUF2868)